MGTVTIQNFTTKKPLKMIGYEAGICYNTKNKKYRERALDCIDSMHGRTLEFPDVYMVLDGYSARVIREFYTHIGGMPTRLQESTRYVNYTEGFEYIIPKSIRSNSWARMKYENLMSIINETMKEIMDTLDTEPKSLKEDLANCLPLGMKTKIVVKINLRNLIEMSHQRLCFRAYWEFRELFKDIEKALSNYSQEWDEIVKKTFMPKCQYLNRCPEKESCGFYEQLSKG